MKRWTLLVFVLSVILAAMVSGGRCWAWCGDCAPGYGVWIEASLDGENWMASSYPELSITVCPGQTVYFRAFTIDDYDTDEHCNVVADGMEDYIWDTDLGNPPDFQDPEPTTWSRSEPGTYRVCVARDDQGTAAPNNCSDWDEGIDGQRLWEWCNLPDGPCECVTINVGPELASVVWEAMDSPLGDNENAGGGKRIYPCKQTPGDTVERRKVRVKATVSPAVAGATVYFRSFDVDDPSASTSPVDATDGGGPTGYDNRGSPQPGALSAASATTDASGVARVEFTVTMQPGDNFRAAASCRQGYLDSCLVADTTTVKHPADGELPTAGAKITEMLTVWRKLHLEVDSMGAVSGNTITGSITNVVNNGNGTSTVTTNQPLDDSANRFVPGTLTNGGHSFSVVSNTTGANFQVTVNNVGQTTPVQGSFTLVDDDGLKDGDDVPGPVTSLLAENFKPAYVTAVFDGGGNPANDQNDAPFNLNVSNEESQAQQSRQSSSAADFWTTHCLGAFQYRKDMDNDPDGEGCWQGVSSGKSALVFVEQNREYGQMAESYRGHILLHEVGHAFRLPDEYSCSPTPIEKYGESYDGIMYWVWKGVFVPQNLACIRSIDYPSKAWTAPTCPCP
jgi:hypothetical protein